MKDLFVGSFGRLNNHGGSRIFTTPNTHNVTPDYLVDTDVPKVAENVTCSLDGRLWAFRRSRRFYVVALRYDELTQEFVAASTIVLNNANFIARGVDWLLTDTTIVQASDDEPYVVTANIFNDSGTSFLYSVLRSKEFASGIDPITKQAWGVSEANGNSEGYGYFNRSALLQSVSKHYSLLPAVGDWHIIKNFLVRKADNPLADAHNNMLNIRPLIPLEFNGSTPAYGCGFDNDIFITCYNGELWARGLHHIGRCYILPAVFDESGNPQEFYLYISPDFPRISLTQAENFNLGILKTDDSLYGFLPSQANSLDNGLCFRSDNPKIFEPSTKQWQQLSESGQMFIDTLNHSGLVLNDDGAIFLNGDSYQCKGLRQWLAPAGVIEAISAQSVISSFDNHALATYPQQEFFREALAGKKLPLSASAYSGKRFSLGCAEADSVKSIQVNSITANNGAEAIAWENVYKQPVDIELINSFTHSFRSYLYEYPIFIVSAQSILHYPVVNSEDTRIIGTEEVLVDGISGGSYLEYDGWSGYLIHGMKSASLHTSISVTLFYIDTDTAKPVFLSINVSLPSVTYIEDPFTILEYSSSPYLDIDNGKIGISYIRGYDYLTKIKFEFIGSHTLPDSFLGYSAWNEGNISLNRIFMDSAIFSEKKSKTIFACHGFNPSNSFNTELFNYWDSNSISDDGTYCKKGFHIAIENNNQFFVFRSELHPEIFDFKSQTERSKLS